MTRDEILAMQPGPELDRVIAERLFGAKMRSYRKYEGGTLLYKLILNRKTFADAFCEPDGPWSALPHYSSTWDGMRLVVEAMAAKGWYASIQRPIGPSWAGKCYAVFVDSTNMLSGTHTADTAPHAVAIAALLALESDHAR